MKMTKSQFKVLMKECLLELVNEGVFDKKIEQITEAKLRTSSPQRLSEQQQQEQPSGPPTDINKNQNIMSAIKTLSSGKAWDGKRSLFEDILKDTAQTTLQKQLREEYGGSGGGMAIGDMVSDAEKQQDQNQLKTMSGGDPARWARAAFAKKKS